MALIYDKDLVYDYILGNDLGEYNPDELSNDYNFMIDVFNVRQDMKMYDLCSDELKCNYSFVKYIINMFKYNKQFTIKVANNYLRNVPYNEVNVDELILILYNYNRENELFALKAEQIYSKNMCFVIKELSENSQEKGIGFSSVVNKYAGSEIVKEFFAKRFLDIIFFNNDEVTIMDMLIIMSLKNGSLEDEDLNAFIIGFVSKIDEELALYVSSNKDLLANINYKILTIFYRKSNDSVYMAERNSKIVIHEMNEYLRQSGFTTVDNYNPFQVLANVAIECGVSDSFDTIIDTYPYKPTPKEEMQEKELVLYDYLKQLMVELFVQPDNKLKKEKRGKK